MASMHVSVIITVYNESHSINRLLDSLASQTHRPDEVVICDGGSTDNTVVTIQNYVRDHSDRLPLVHVLVEPGANISRGRNVAITAACGPLIAVTDAGVRLSPHWLEQLVAPWQKNQAVAPLAVAGFFLPDAKGVFQTAMAATVLPLASDIDPNQFLPSSRSVAFTKATWAKTGGYPEWLDYCEDVVFDLRVKAQRGPFRFAPRACVSFRPRPDLSAFYRQYFRYARGDGKADLFFKRHVVRYATYLIGLPAIVWGALAVSPWIGLAGLAGGAVYASRAVARLTRIWAHYDARDRLRMLFWLPVILFTGDLAKMLGYPVGVAWRWRHPR